MRNVQVSWNPPSVVAYSSLEAAVPGLTFNSPTIDPNIKGYIVQYKRISENTWQTAGETSIPSIRILNLDDDSYIIRVAAIDLQGRQSPWSLSLPNSAIINLDYLFDIESNAIMLGIL